VPPAEAAPPPPPASSPRPPPMDASVAALLHKADAPVESVVDLIGGTPLVRLSRCVPGAGATVLAKLESMQPNSSVKDR